MLISASYLKKIDILCSPLYLPNDQDVLHTYTETVGIVDSRVKLGELDCSVTDVSGTRSSRKGWLHLSSSVHCVIFTAPLSGYDQCLFEDNLAVNSLLPETLPLEIPIFC